MRRAGCRVDRGLWVLVKREGKHTQTQHALCSRLFEQPTPVKRPAQREIERALSSELCRQASLISCIFKTYRALGCITLVHSFLGSRHSLVVWYKFFNYQAFFALTTEARTHLTWPREDMPNYQRLIVNAFAFSCTVGQPRGAIRLLYTNEANQAMNSNYISVADFATPGGKFILCRPTDGLHSYCDCVAEAGKRGLRGVHVAAALAAVPAAARWWCATTILAQESSLAQ